MRLFLACYLPLAIAYGDTWVWIWDRWMQGEYYSHGPLLPIVAVFVVLNQRTRWTEQPATPDRRGWWLLGLGLLLRFAGAAQTVDSLSAASLMPSIAGLVQLTVGWRRLVSLLPVIGLLALATPMPMDLTGRVAFELKEVSIRGALAICEMVDLGVFRHGANIKVPGQAVMLPVADACGGLRSLLALSTLGYCLAFFMGSSSFKRRAVIILLTVPLAAGVNILRIVGLCVMAKRVDVYYAGGTGHTIMNLSAWVVNIGILLLVDSLLERGRPGRRPLVAQEARA
ncbi:MAG: exosortase/archaeosortase family protein [Planctomycetes bacterium]|nr:exosortase/archaeosortase family protein [Planctomycetota bacterium]MCB9869494.1 exosortase/archaeosortase family protein [Planctomycetota bacterium]